MGDGKFLKQPQRQTKKREPKKANATDTPERIVVTGPDEGRASSQSMQHDINHVAGLDGVEQSLDWIARSLSQLTSDDTTVGVVLGQNRYAGPVKISFADNDEDDTVNRLVTAFERIADSVARLAGLSRPRLESWHEQDEYEPRYKDIAVDGGAPGPKASTRIADVMAAQVNVEKTT